MVDLNWQLKIDRPYAGPGEFHFRNTVHTPDGLIFDIYCDIINDDIILDGYEYTDKFSDIIKKFEETARKYEYHSIRIVAGIGYSEIDDCISTGFELQKNDGKDCWMIKKI